MMAGCRDEEESGTTAGAHLSHPLLLLPTSPVSASYRCECVLLLLELICSLTFLYWYIVKTKLSHQPLYSISYWPNK
jgi:hypothetical protein